MLSFSKIFGYYLLILYIKSCHCDETCNRIPLGITSAALPPDNRYHIEIDKIGENYLPDTNYTVFLKAEDKAKFIAFSISATGDTKNNTDNPRRPIILKAGEIWPSGDDDNAKISNTCNNTVVENHIMPKSLVQVIWRTPPKGNGCVTISAMVAIRRDIYYSNQGPLTTRVCEDSRKLEDMPPKFNLDCQACYDAKYKLTFEGLWSYNTHLGLYPMSNKSSINQASFSDIVGASHNSDYTIFRSNEEASVGVRTLAEQGNTTELEVDMQEKIGKSVRTIIKANSPPTTTSNKTALFRVSAQHHLVSVATAILPSPDWFLGASSLELCNAETNRWTDHITLNLYPLDAGTDKGTDFNSANDIMMPAQPIGLAKFMHVNQEKVKPFARIHLDLIRIYDLTPGCFDKNDDEEGNEVGGVGDENGNKEPEENLDEHVRTITTSTEPPVVTDPESTADCPMTAWEEWEPCDGPCEGGKIIGAHSRFRYHIVDDVPVKYTEEGILPKVPESCVDNFKDIDIEMCEENCEETTTVDPVIAQQRVASGRSWKIWS